MQVIGLPLILKSYGKNRGSAFLNEEESSYRHMHKPVVFEDEECDDLLCHDDEYNLQDQPRLSSQIFRFLSWRLLKRLSKMVFDEDFGVPRPCVLMDRFAIFPMDN